MNHITPFVITREFHAPRDLFWKVQTQGKHLQRWLRPEGFHTIHPQSFSDKDGGLGRHPMAPHWPAYMHVTATYEDSSNGGTIYTISWQPYDGDETGIATFEGARPGMQAGFAETFAKPDTYLVEVQESKP